MKGGWMIQSFQQQLSVSERSNIRNVNAHQHNRTETFTCRQVAPLTSDLCLCSNVSGKLPRRTQKNLISHSSERYLQSFLLLTCRFPGKLDSS